MAKIALIKARVTASLKRAVEERAASRGESEAVIVREALNAYLLKDDDKPITTQPVRPPGPVRYTKPLTK